MTWREMVGWGLVASASICDTLAALVKCGAFEALTEANQAHRLRRDGPGALATRAVKGRGFVGTCYLRRLRNNPRRHSLTQPTRTTLPRFRGGFGVKI